IGWGGNQSLRAILTRFAGSIHGATAAWMVAALLAAAIGLASAVLLDRAGHTMLAILATALVGLLDSPISWDHHWVWVVPGMMAAAHYAAVGWRSRRRVPVGDLALMDGGAGVPGGMASGGAASSGGAAFPRGAVFRHG